MKTAAIEQPSPPAPPWSIRSASLTSGFGLLLMSALSGFGIFVALEGLITPGNAAQTASDVMGSQALFRYGIASLFLVVVLDVVVAWGLYRVFSPVNKGISMLAAWLRLAYAAVFLVAISQLLGVLRLLSSADSLAAFSPAQRQAQAMLGISAFEDVWNAGLVLFGVHLLVLGYLAYQSGNVPRILAILVAIAGLGYVFDSLRVVVSQGSMIDLSSFTFIGEFLLAIWLVSRGGRIDLKQVEAQEDRVR